MEYQEAYQQARKTAKAKVGFYIHLTIYVAVITVLTIINLASTADYLWVKWPLMGWGIGVLFHGLGVFVFSERSSLNERMIEREMRKQGWKEDDNIELG